MLEQNEKKPVSEEEIPGGETVEETGEIEPAAVESEVEASEAAFGAGEENAEEETVEADTKDAEAAKSDESAQVDEEETREGEAETYEVEAETDETEGTRDEEDDSYDPYEDDVVEDDDEHFAAVAERITGARHTRATTAAPLRVREDADHAPTAPKATAGIPVREKTEEKGGAVEEVPSAEASAEDVATTDATTAEATPAEAPDKEPFAFLGDKKTFVTIVASACALILLLVSIIIVINGASNEEYPTGQPADIVIGDTYEHAEVITPSVSDPVDDKTEDSGEETDPSQSEEETEAETVPQATKFTVTLDFFDKEDVTVVTEAIVLSELLTKAGCKLDEADVPSVSLDSLIAASTTVKIDKHAWVSETATEEIPFETVQVDVDTIPRGTTNWIQNGENGVITKTYTVEYVNGVEMSRTLISEETTKWPVTAKYEYGVGGSFVGGDGKYYTYSHRMVVRATYYNWEGLTHLGMYVDDTALAVDPNLIPLGTHLYVKNDKYDFGYRLANDTGADIKGDWIDIWISKEDAATIHKEFCDIGFHYDMEVYFID